MKAWLATTTMALAGSSAGAGTHVQGEWPSVGIDDTYCSGCTERVGRGDELTTVAASGFRKRGGRQDRPEHVIDGKDATAWCVGGTSSPIGAWVELRFSRPVSLSLPFITPHYWRGGDLAAHARVAKARISTDKGQDLIVSLPDPAQSTEARAKRLGIYVLSEEAWIAWSGPDVKTVRFTVLELYPGRSDQDVCLAEIIFLRTPFEGEETD